MTVPGCLIALMMTVIKVPLEVKSRNTGNSGSSSGTSHTVTLPSGIVANDLILVFFVSDQADAISWGGTGFTEIRQLSDSNVTLASAYKWATGGETSISVTIAGSQKTAYTTYRVSGAKNPLIQAPEASAGAEDNNSFPNPDSLTPTGGIKEYLWIAVNGHNTGRDVTGFPTNYINGLQDKSNPTGACGIGSAERIFEASVQNPGLFTLSSSDDWHAFTVAIHPA